jgi:hypothetical protein
MATLYHQVWIDAPVAKVYEALATAEGLGNWWAPHTSTDTDDGLVLAHSPGAAHGDVQMKVLASTPNRRVEWEIISTHPKRSPASAWTGTHIIFGEYCLSNDILIFFPLVFVVTRAIGGKHGRLSEMHASARGQGWQGPG